MSKFLPIGDTPDFRYRVDLEGQGYDIRLRWNSRSQSWYIYIGFTGEEPAVKTRLVNGYNLLEPYRGVEGAPPGNLYVVDIEKAYGRPSLDDVGLEQRFRLLYVRSTEDDPIRDALVGE